MAQDVWGGIESAARDGQVEVVIDRCLVLDEAARRSVSTRAQRLARELRPTEAEILRALGGRAGDDDPRAPGLAAAAALFCVGPPPTQRSPAQVPPARLLDAVRSRPRDWRLSWAERALEREWDMSAWQACRALIRAGELDKPPHPVYTRAMVRHALPFIRGGRPRDALLADPGLLEDDVWRIFELEEKTLTVPWYGWADALIELAAEGAISRDRLLDESLAALRRDFSPAVAASFSSFHDRLAPTPPELAARTAEYLGLLGSPVDSTVGFALRHLSTLWKGGGLDARELIPALAPALAVRPRGHVTRAIGLLVRAARREPALAGQGVEVALVALGHSDAGVQGAALEAVATLADLCGGVPTSVAAAVAQSVPQLDPGLRERAAALSGGSASPATVAPGDLAAASGGSAEPAAGDHGARRDAALAPAVGAAVTPTVNVELTPVRDLEELLELTAVLLERADSADELERFLDGLSRLCAEAVPEAREAALLGRVDAELRRWPGLVVQGRTAVAVLAHHWLRGGPPRTTFAGFAVARGPGAAIGRRLRALAARAQARRAGPWLSAPTERGGWIEPGVLAHRIETAREVYDADLAQALLRVRSDPDGVVKPSLGRLGDLTAFPAARDSLDLLADSAVLVIEPEPSLHAPGFEWNAPPVVAPPSSPARLLVQFDRGWGAGVDATMHRWLALVWPANLDPYCAVHVRRHRSPGLWTTGPERELRAALDPLREPGIKFTPPALELLAAALGSVTSDRLAAAEVLEVAIASGRVGGARLGRAIAAELARDGAVPDRWADSLGAAAPAGSSLEVAQAVQASIEGLLAELPAGHPRMTGVVDLLRRLALEHGQPVTEPAARAWLETTTGSSKTGRLARAALAVA